MTSLHQQLVYAVFLLFIWGCLSNSDHSVGVKVQLEKTSLIPQEQVATANTEIKCGPCPCVDPCVQQFPPPPPRPPPSPKTQKHKPATQNCNPVMPLTPPPPRFIYVTAGDPDNSYQPDHHDNYWNYYSGAGRHVVLGCTMLLLLFSCIAMFGRL